MQYNSVYAYVNVSALQGALLRVCWSPGRKWWRPINRFSVGLNGSVPTLFAPKGARQFSDKTCIKLKLMGIGYRYLGYKPDDFEVEVLRIFVISRHPKGESYGRTRWWTARHRSV